MLDIDSFEYNETSEKIVKALQNKTQSNNENFFRILVSYQLTKLAATMRTNIATHDRGVIPVNMYAINLAPSGTGKGYATNIIEEAIINPFKENFLATTYQSVAERTLFDLANERALKEVDGDPEVEMELITKEFEALGHMLFSFDSGTTPALKQMRHKLLMAGSGSLSMEIDEIGSNLLSNVDVLTTYLELYDVGKVKQKLIKNTAENKRNQDIDGKTPANLLWFGTPTKVLDGDKVEQEFTTMLETGYARRCLFGHEKVSLVNSVSNASELYDILTNSNVDMELDAIAQQLVALSDEAHFGRDLEMDKETHILLLEYKIQCSKIASQKKEHEELAKAEMEHRYYKALKLAGTYAFIANSPSITSEHIKNAIKMTELSGKNFEQIIKRDKPFVKIAKFIVDSEFEVTNVDLVDNLPFYRGSESHKRDLMNLAIAYGYKNNMIIQKQQIDQIDFYSGKTLKETDVNDIIVSYSKDTVTDYQPDRGKFMDMPKIISTSEYYFTVHHFQNEYRNADNVIPGFNLIVLDIDGTASIATAQLLLKDYRYIMYTTKSHSDVEDRFRIILPMSHELELGVEDYRLFMCNVFNWLPFDCDEATKDIARKWAGNDGAQIIENSGKLIDATLFIPKTKKEEESRNEFTEYTNLTALEKWFLRETREGNRSDMLLKYGLVLKDNNYPIDAIRNMIDNFNAKLTAPLSDEEISRSIMITIAKRMK